MTSNRKNKVYSETDMLHDRFQLQSSISENISKFLKKYNIESSSNDIDSEVMAFINKCEGQNSDSDIVEIPYNPAADAIVAAFGMYNTGNKKRALQFASKAFTMEGMEELAKALSDMNNLAEESSGIVVSQSEIEEIDVDDDIESDDVDLESEANIQEIISEDSDEEIEDDIELDDDSDSENDFDNDDDDFDDDARDLIEDPLIEDSDEEIEDDSELLSRFNHPDNVRMLETLSNSSEEEKRIILNKASLSGSKKDIEMLLSIMKR